MKLRSSASSSSVSSFSSSNPFFSPPPQSSHIETRRSERVRFQPTHYAYEQEDSLVVRNWSREYALADEEPDEYEVDSETEEKSIPMSPPSDDEEKKEDTTLDEDGWSFSRQQTHRTSSASSWTMLLRRSTGSTSL